MGAEESAVEPREGSRWIAELDHLRGFAIIAVVMNHVAVFSLADKSPEVTYVNLFLITASGFGVITLFFVSGMVLSNRYPHPVSAVGFYKRRLRAVIPPYIVVSSLFIIYLSMFSSAPRLDSAAVFYLTGSASHSLWFVAVLVQFYLLYPLIIFMYDRFERRGTELWLIGLCLILQVSWNSLSVLLVGRVPLIVLDRLFLSYLLFFVLGIYAGRRVDGFRSLSKGIPWTPLAILTIASFAATAAMVHLCIQKPMLGDLSVFNFYLVTSLAWPALLLVSYKASLSLAERQGRWGQAVKELGRASFGIYLLHLFVLGAIVAMLVRLDVRWDDLEFYPLELVGTVLLTYLLVRLLSRMPRSELLIGR